MLLLKQHRTRSGRPAATAASDAHFLSTRYQIYFCMVYHVLVEGLQMAHLEYFQSFVKTAALFRLARQPESDCRSCERQLKTLILFIRIASAFEDGVLQQRRTQVHRDLNGLRLGATAGANDMERSRPHDFT